MDLGNCRSNECRAPLRWTITEKGKRIPLDRDPIPREEARANPRGVFYLDDRGRAVAWNPAMLIDIDEDLFRSHWATCKHPEEFRT